MDVIEFKSCGYSSLWLELIIWQIMLLPTFESIDLKIVSPIMPPRNCQSRSWDLASLHKFMNAVPNIFSNDAPSSNFFGLAAEDKSWWMKDLNFAEVGFKTISAKCVDELVLLVPESWLKWPEGAHNTDETKNYGSRPENLGNPLGGRNDGAPWIFSSSRGRRATPF